MPEKTHESPLVFDTNATHLASATYFPFLLTLNGSDAIVMNEDYSVSVNWPIVEQFYVEYKPTKDVPYRSTNDIWIYCAMLIAARDGKILDAGKS